MIAASARPCRKIICRDRPPLRAIHERTRGGYMSHSACVPTSLVIGRP